MLVFLRPESILTVEWPAVFKIKGDLMNTHAVESESEIFTITRQCDHIDLNFFGRPYAMHKLLWDAWDAFIFRERAGRPKRNNNKHLELQIDRHNLTKRCVRGHIPYKNQGRKKLNTTTVITPT